MTSLSVQLLGQSARWMPSDDVDGECKAILDSVLRFGIAQASGLLGSRESNGLGKASSEDPLSSSFFEDLYVPQREEALFKALQLNGRLLLLHGDTGVGKSTALVRQLNQLAQSREAEDTEYLYIDAYALHAYIAATDFDELGMAARILVETHLDSVAARADFERTIVPTLPDLGFLRRDVWQEPHPFIPALRQPSRSHLDDLEGGDRSRLREALDKWWDSRGFVQLSYLIPYIRISLGIQVVIAVDNLDQSPAAFQEGIADQLQRLLSESRLRSAILVVRTENLGRIRAAIDNVKLLSEIETQRLSPTPEFLYWILRARMSKADSLARQVANDDDGRRLLQRCNETLRDLARNVDGEIHLGEQGQEIIRTLLDWNNRSIRASCHGAIELLRRLFAESRGRRGLSPLQRIRLTRNATYRYLFRDINNPLAASGLLLTDQASYLSEISPAETEIPFLPLWLLQRIYRLPTRSTIKDLFDWAETHGVSEGQLLGAIDGLTAAHGEDKWGFVRPEFSRLAPAEVVGVVPLASTNLLFDRVLGSVEYLLANALVYDRPDEFMRDNPSPFVHGLSYDELDSDDVKILVSLSYYRNLILPRVTGWLSAKGTIRPPEVTRQGVVSAMRSLIESAGKYFYTSPERLRRRALIESVLWDCQERFAACEALIT